MLAEQPLKRAVGFAVYNARMAADLLTFRFAMSSPKEMQNRWILYAEVRAGHGSLAGNAGRSTLKQALDPSKRVSNHPLDAGAPGDVLHSPDADLLA